MGFDSVHQAIPEDWPPLEMAKQDAALGAVLQLTSHNLRGEVPRKRIPWAPPPEMVILDEHVAQLLRDRPGIEQRFFEPSARTWDLLHYLLSADRRRLMGSSWRDVPPDPGTIAARGAADIGPLAKASQGSPLRFSNAHQVREAAAFLDSVTDDALHSFFEPALVEAAGVYKFWADRAAQWWPSILGDFYALRALHTTAAEHGEGVLVCVD